MLAYSTAERIRTRLDELERNQAWLARKAGVDLSTVYRWLTEERPIPAKRLPQLAQILGVSVEDISPHGEPVAA